MRSQKVKAEEAAGSGSSDEQRFASFGDHQPPRQRFVRAVLPAARWLNWSGDAPVAGK